MQPNIFDRENGIPMYRQLAEYLKKQITSGEYRPGDVLPSEADLIRDFNVSRTTVRLAFGMITNAGLVRREQGRGTIVVAQVRTKLATLSSFSEDVEQMGRKPGALLLSKTVETPPLDVARVMDLSQDEPAIKVVRLRLADNEPIGLAVSWLNVARFPTLNKLDFSATSIYQLFEKNLGLTIRNAKEHAWADLAEEHEARKLKIKTGSAVLRMTRVTYVQGEEGQPVPIEYVEVLFNGSAYSIETDLYRQSKS